MADRGKGAVTGHAALINIALPVVLLFIVIALLAGLVFSGVLQGNVQRVGPNGSTTTQPTIIIEP